MRELTPEYLAGFFDGEGTISPHKPTTTRGRDLQVGLANNVKPILEQVKLQFKGNLSRSGGNCWQWQATSAINKSTFLTLVFPYLIIKQEEVAIGLAILSKTNTPGKFYTDREFLVREKLFDLLVVVAEKRKQIYA